MALPLTDNSSEAAKVARAEKYEQITHRNNELRSRIQSRRREKSVSNRYRGALHRVYEKYRASRHSLSPTDDANNSNTTTTTASNNNSNNTQTKPGIETAISDSNNNHSHNDDYKYNKDLTMLECHLSENQQLRGHGNKVYSCDWNRNNHNELVSVGRDGKLIFWNADTGYKRAAYPLDTEFIMTLQYAPDSSHVACGGLDDVLSIFSTSSDYVGLIKDIEPTVYKAHAGYISCVAHVDNNRVLSASGDCTIRLWDLAKHHGTGSGSSQHSKSHSESGAALTQSDTVPLFTYRIHREDVTSIQMHPTDQNMLLTGSVDSTAKIVDLRVAMNATATENAAYVDSDSYNDKGNVTHSFYMGYESDNVRKNRSMDVNVVRWFPDGNSFATGCDDGTIRLFDRRSGGLLNEYSYRRHYLNAGVALDQKNSNQSVATSTNTTAHHDSEVKQNDCDEEEKQHIAGSKPSDEEASPFEEEDDEATDGVSTFDFSASGAFMFVSYNNNQHKVLTWNVLSGEVVHELSHADHVPCMRVSPDGTKLATACWDHQLKIW
eukprot:CAMPEP_0202692004 /NCGR_PEP_ID=MMETSP1385-20130828/6517_1 /ASSEMBLY_ACC=CAM_ASM_000861 /TAXON_ID=933848 /ORGANISM="Elphidium margaritaceum" /LENGTH=547 /DNA_ID=CAMNT_0049347469 /DNA_START=142 /DNA_END=1782 /DNA_ORIENTATION=+